jgi:hypothetical protein
MKEVNGFIVAQKKENTKFSFRVYAKDSLLNYGFTKAKNNGLNAIAVQGVINYFNCKRFGITSYKIIDDRQIPEEVKKALPKPLDLKTTYVKFKLEENGSAERTSTLGTTAEICVPMIIAEEWWFDIDGNADPCHCSGNETYAYYLFNF